MTGTVTVYFNTGFNGIDIPASPSVLTTAANTTYNDVYYMREDIDKPTIRIKDTYENLRDVDYVSITTSKGTSYYFASPSALAKGVTVIALDLDALLTMGGAANLEYISGWQERGHIAKADDVLFGNTAAEDWIPSQPLESANMQGLSISSSAQRDLDIIISNIAINSLGASALTQDVIEGIVAGDVDPVMYFPSIETVGSATGFYIYDFQETQEHSFALPNTGAFDPTVTNVKNGLQKLFSCGQLQLQASYQIPKEYVSGQFGVTAGQYTNLHGVHGEDDLQNIPFEYSIAGYTPKNKKVYATYRNYVIANIGSGDMSIKDPAEIYDGSAAPSILIWSDPTSTGKPYARFKYIKGNPLQYVDCVRGLQWANSQIVMEGASGSVWNSLNTAFSNQQLQRSQSLNLFNQSVALQQGAIQAQKIGNEYTAFGINQTMGILGGLPGAVVGAIGGGMESATGYGMQTLGKMAQMQLTDRNMQLNLESLRTEMSAAQGRTEMANQNIQNQINQNAIGLLKSNSVIAPTVSFTPEQNLGLYGYNKFVIYEVRKSAADLKSEDQYYQRFGYNGLHRPLTKQCFNERDYYCYVQAFDVNLKGAGNSEYGLRVRTKAIAQLNKGVRVWKVKPDASYYESN